jgi:hypothetical protein
MSLDTKTKCISFSCIEGLFIINQQLEPGTYQAFVDVTPKNHVYSVHPIELQIGSLALIEFKVT